MGYQGEPLNVPRCYGGAMPHDCYHLLVIQRRVQEINQSRSWSQSGRSLAGEEEGYACRERDVRKGLPGTCMKERGGA